ncbi:hypothetical protein ACLF6K_04265 [Streptomyces xanthophaeus]|uniref:hypothetical protein n=1 Tax=Streptomyces xanthophaeus TaxID=67385 RepID=UPI00398FC169
MLWSGWNRLRRERRARAAARTVQSYRNPPQELWDVLAVAATDTCPHVCWEAGEAVAEAGPAVAVHADRFSAFVAGPPADVGHLHVQHTLLALAGLGDVRAAGPLGAVLERGSLPLVHDRRHVPTLATLPAAALLPAVRRGLRLDPERYAHQTAIDVLAAWGADAAPATPELIAHLHGPHARDAVRALGRIGPGAAAAADLLADFALGRSRPQRPGGEPGPRRWNGAQTAAWAHWRITGDDSLALAVCGAAVRAGAGRPVLGHLADLGPAAADHADAVRALLGSPGAWTRAGAAHAWWRITGESAEAVPVLLGALQPDRAGHPAFPTLDLVRHFGAIGAPAAQARPVLQAMPAAGERITCTYGTGRNILEDEALCRALAEALERIEG